MTVFFAKEKHLEVDSARLTESGDIEVLFPKYEDAKAVFLVLYELDWLLVIEKPYIEPWETEFARYDCYMIENQLDVYRLNASL